MLEPTVTAEVTVTWPLKSGKKLVKTLPAQTATEELWVALPGMPDAEGEGRLSLRLNEPPGTLCYQGQFTFPVTLEAPPLEATQLGLVPRPKQLVYHPGAFALPAQLEAHVVSRPEICTLAVGALTQELRDRFGRELRTFPEKLYKNNTAVLLLTPPDAKVRLPQEVVEKLPQVHEQGYLLHVDPRGNRPGGPGPGGHALRDDHAAAGLALLALGRPRRRFRS